MATTKKTRTPLFFNKKKKQSKNDEK